MSEEASSRPRRASRRRLTLTRNGLLAGVARLLNESRADVARQTRAGGGQAEDEGDEDLEGDEGLEVHRELMQLVMRDEGGAIRSPDDLFASVLADREFWLALRRNRSLDVMTLVRSEISAKASAQLSKTLRASRGPAAVNLEGARLCSVRAPSALLQDAQRGTACKGLNLSSTYATAGEAPFKVLSGRASTCHVGPGKVRVDFHGAFTTVALKEMATLRTGSGSFYYEVDLSGWPADASWADARIGWTDTWWVATTFEDASGSSGGAGVGDNLYSWAFDPFRARALVDNRELDYGARCGTGDIIGCFVDLNTKLIRFSVNGSWEAPFGTAFRDISLWKGIVPALTVASSRHFAASVVVNFGPDFAHPPDHAIPISDWLERQKESLMRSALRKSSERQTNRALHSLLLSEFSCLQTRQRPHSVSLLCQAFQGLRYLDLSRSQLGDAGCSYLCRELADGLPSLLALDLSGNEISPTGASRLSRALLHSGLQYLDLAENDLGAQAAAAAYTDESAAGLEWTTLVGSGLGLVVLDLSRSRVGATAGRALMEKLADNEVLRGLRLDGNPLTSECIRPLGDMLRRNRTLRHLSLVSTSLEHGWSSLSPVFFDSSSAYSSDLQALDIAGNAICTDAFEDVNMFFTGRGGLRRFGLGLAPSEDRVSRPRIASKRAESAQRLLRALGTSQPSTLLAVHIDALAHARVFAEAFQAHGCNFVQHLELSSSTDLLDVALSAVAREAPNLRKLVVRAVDGPQRRSDVPWGALKKVLGAATLEVLRVEGEGSPVDATAHAAFAGALGENRALRQLSIAGVPMMSVLDELFDAAGTNTSLKSLSVESCHLNAVGLASLARLIRKSQSLRSIKFARGNGASHAAESALHEVLASAPDARAERCRRVLLFGGFADLDAFKLTAVALSMITHDLPLLGALLQWLQREVLERSRGPIELTNTVTIDGTVRQFEHQSARGVDGSESDAEPPLLLGDKVIFQGQLTIRNWTGKIELFPSSPSHGTWRAIGLHLIDCPELRALPQGLELATLVVRRCHKLRSLPQDLRVWTMVVLEDLPELAALPATLDLDHLEIRNCTALQSVASAKIRDTLVLSRCTQVGALPDDLAVDKLIVEGCPLLREGFVDARVGEHLSIRGSPVQSLPAGLSLEECHLDECASLEELPADLVVRRAFSVSHCPLRKVPRGVRADSISLISLPMLTRVGSGSQARHKLVIQDSPSLAELPRSLLAAGKQRVEIRDAGLRSLPDALDLVSCHLIQCAELELPSALKVKRELRIEQCGTLQLPRDLQTGSLLVSQCLNVVGIPSGAVCRGNMVVDSCPSLEHLPDILNLRGGLILRKLPSLRSLPENVRARTRVDIRDCTRLERLSERLRTDRLLLSDNPELGLVPDSTRVAVSIRVFNCGSLHSLPDATIRNVQRIIVDATSPLGRDADLDFLDARCGALQTVLEVDIDNDEAEREPEHECLDEAVAFWESHAGATPALELESVLDSFHHSSVLGFLNLLRRSAEFRRPDLREGLAQRVVELLRIIEADPDGVRDELLSRISDAIDSCSDKPIWALNDMFLMTLIIDARGDRSALRSLGKRVMRLQIVRDHARQHPGAEQDDVCVYLRYEITLREELDLPVSSVAMLYRSFVSVTAEEIAAARDAALGVSEADFEMWLRTWPEWERQLRAETAEKIKYEALEAEALSRRSSLRAFSGEPMDQPVLVSRRGPWELSELVERWVVTGLDFANVALAPADFVQSLKRAIPRW